MCRCIAMTFKSKAVCALREEPADWLRSLRDYQLHLGSFGLKASFIMRRSPTADSSPLFFFCFSSKPNLDGATTRASGLNVGSLMSAAQRSREPTHPAPLFCYLATSESAEVGRASAAQARNTQQIKQNQSDANATSLQPQQRLRSSDNLGFGGLRWA